MSEEEKNVHRLSSTECAQTICTCLHGHALSFTCYKSEFYEELSLYGQMPVKILADVMPK